MGQRPMVISIIGRPNVGKSSIFNRLMRKQNKALTHDCPGVTRDRHYGITTFSDLANEEPADCILVDTGGFYPQKIYEDDLNNSDSKRKKSASDPNFNKFFNIMASHAKLAISESDLVLFVVDIKEGVLPFDLEISNYLRSCQVPFWVLINKYDTHKQDTDEAEFYSLGVDLDKMFLVSAAHGGGFFELRDLIHKEILEFKNNNSAPLGISSEQFLQIGVAPQKDVISKLAIIGAPNVGKSTLLNLLVGSDRALVSNIPGTTVDPIEGYFELKFEIDEGDLWQSVQIVDTAGIRKKKSVDGYIESQSVYRSLRSITEADIVIYMAEATKGIGHQDRRMLDIALEKGKSIILCLNKIDLLGDQIKEQKDRTDWLLDVRDKIPWLTYCDVVPISAAHGKGIKLLKKTIKKTVMIRQKNIPTGELNRLFSELIDRHSVTLKRSGGRPFKIKYASMLKSTPPTFLLFTNKSKEIPQSYRRYLKNGIRKKFGFDNTPIHLIFR